MKKLLLFILIPILVVLGTPSVLLAMMYDGDARDLIPVHLYSPEADSLQLLEADLLQNFEDFKNGVTDDLTLQLTEDVVNVMIFEAIREGVNPEYMPTDTCESEVCNYVVYEAQSADNFDFTFKVVGIWADFEEDQLIIHALLEVTLQDSVTYMTDVKTQFFFKEYDDRYVAEFTGVVVGNLPLPKSLFTSMVATAQQNIDDINIDDIEAQIPIGDLDIDQFTYTLYKDDIVQFVVEKSEDPNTGLLFGDLLNLVFDNSLIAVGIAEDNVYLNFNLSKITNEDTTNLPTYLNEYREAITVDGVTTYGAYNADIDAEAYFQSELQDIIISRLIEGNAFELSEELINRVFYISTEGFSAANIDLANELEIDVEDLTLAMQGMYVELNDNQVVVNVLYEIFGVKSQLKVTVDVTATAEDYTLSLSSVTLGQDEGESSYQYLTFTDLENFKETLKSLDLGDIGSFNEEGDLVITLASLQTYLEQNSGDQQPQLKSIDFAEGKIALDIDFGQDYSQVFNDVVTEVDRLLEDEVFFNDLTDILNDDDPAKQEALAAIEELQDAFLALDDITEIDTDLIMDVYQQVSELDAETQQALFDLFNENFDQSILDSILGQ